MNENTYRNRIEAHLQTLRGAELGAIRARFKPDMRVLELGGGSGYQASRIASYGCDVASIDLADRSVPIKSYFTVKEYDGKHIPFEKNTFDIVFSSNVLEHIHDLPQILNEVRRVLKPEGIAIHILPSSSWRFWTSVSHYFFLLKCLIHRRILYSSQKQDPSVNHLNKSYSQAGLMKQALLAGPHGAYPSAIAELYYFSQNCWLKLFKHNRFYVIQIAENHVFYTGYILFLGLSLKIRKKMAEWMGSSCYIYIMRPTSEEKN